MNQETAQSRKKVLFVVTKSNWGGAQKYVYDLATSIPRDRFVPVVAAGPAQGSDAPGELLQKLEGAGIRTIFIPEMRRDVSIADFGTFRAFLRLFASERPDVLHLNSSKAGGLGALAARLRGIPRIIFTVHGWAFRERRNVLSRLLIYIVSALTALLAHTVICISRYDRDAFGGFPYISRRFKLIRNGSRAGTALLSRAEARAHMAIRGREQSVWIVSNSELTHNKNIKAALDALALARRSEPRLFYVIISEGEQLEKLRLYAERTGLSSDVHFTGYVPNAARLMKAFDIFLLTSRKEGLPYVLLEAAEASVPVVATDVGGISELVENGVNGALCAPGDIMGIADSIVELAADPALRDRFAAALHDKVSKEYSFDRMVQETTALY